MQAFPVLCRYRLRAITSDENERGVADTDALIIDEQSGAGDARTSSHPIDANRRGDVCRPVRLCEKVHHVLGSD